MTTCRRAPLGAKPILIYENLPIGVKFSFGGMSHAALPEEVHQPYKLQFEKLIGGFLLRK